MNSNKFSKSGGIIVSCRFRVPKSFHSRVGWDDLIFKSSFQFIFFFRFFRFLTKWCNNRKIRDDLKVTLTVKLPKSVEHFQAMSTIRLQNFYLFSIDGFPSTWFTSNQHRLIFTVDQHVGVSIIGNSIQMRRHFSSSFTLFSKKIQFYYRTILLKISKIWNLDPVFAVFTL